MKTEWTKHLVTTGVLAALIAPAGLMIGGMHISTAAAASPAEETMPGVNVHAKRVVESNTEGMYDVPADGQVWLYDATDKDVEHSISVKKGFKYGFNSEKNVVLVNGKDGSRVDLSPKHSYRIYYVSNADRGGPAKEEDLIPHDARLVVEARGKNLEYKGTGEDGILYLWDRSDQELVNTFHVKGNDVLFIEPGKDRIVLNDKVIDKDAGLKTDVDYRLLLHTRQ